MIGVHGNTITQIHIFNVILLMYSWCYTPTFRYATCSPKCMNAQFYNPHAPLINCLSTPSSPKLSICTRSHIILYRSQVWPVQCSLANMACRWNKVSINLMAQLSFRMFTSAIQLDLKSRYNIVTYVRKLILNNTWVICFHSSQVNIKSAKISCLKIQ